MVLPIEHPPDDFFDAPDFKLEGDLAELTETFGVGNQATPFLYAGVMWKTAGVDTACATRPIGAAASAEGCSPAV